MGFSIFAHLSPVRTRKEAPVKLKTKKEVHAFFVRRDSSQMTILKPLTLRRM
jgi:hypothetical protein